jgi:hypothetical protein
MKPTHLDWCKYRLPEDVKRVSLGELSRFELSKLFPKVISVVKLSLFDPQGLPDVGLWLFRI